MVLIIDSDLIIGIFRICIFYKNGVSDKRQESVAFVLSNVSYFWAVHGYWLPTKKCK